MKLTRMDPDATHTIGTLRETSLHAALKTWYARPGDELEASVEGYQIDLRRGAQLIEIQTRNFAALKHKLAPLPGPFPARGGKTPHLQSAAISDAEDHLLPAQDGHD